ncbi:gliding motility lipoprotein GldD [Psychroflexus sp. S27]|uniref:gliding motility lipoprotein GldD n=1 Tax=Psychroflexus sp. S27 TaxID=1982757 RepID=UPI000C2B42DB|nr:gliding motility lipoprotein GldD [Psychroflexus sp. S27]PJX27516.1 gliding motility lipoprotein GldD [Psychroflexus sp. S27]
MNLKLVSFLLLFVFLTMSCQTDVQPKAKAFLDLNYPDNSYKQLNTNCHFYFDVNELVKIDQSKNYDQCSFDIVYPQMDATIFFSYKKVNNNLRELLSDAQKLPLKHTIKADAIEVDVYSNDETKTYGNFYEVEGDAASQAQFYLTDSVNHFVTASIYFKTRPNYDSILPAAAYLKKDLKRMVESLRWTK